MADGEIGYGKPPKSTRFPPGQSGNPGGRPTKRPSLGEDLAAELGEEVRVNEGGGALTVSKQRALIKALIREALGGDPRAAKTILDLVRALAPEDHRESEHDAALVEDFIKHEIDRKTKKEP